ncbi:MAG TPA: TadE/TadG family type IV pilus assembly protein [Chloroflexota bacterium]|nr:TadE/TadG family type IV pilus assembly protein [Chloroflexota bacterium]
MVEFALTIVLFFTTLLLIFEGGRMVLSYFILANAAAEGARAGQYVTATDTDIQNAVNAVSGILGTFPTPTSGSTCSGTTAICVCRRTTAGAACGSTPIQSGSEVDVTVNYLFQFMPQAGGWLGQTSIQLTAYHTARLS